jgi:hypothetical protein
MRPMVVAHDAQCFFPAALAVDLIGKCGACWPADRGNWPEDCRPAIVPADGRAVFVHDLDEQPQFVRCDDALPPGGVTDEVVGWVGTAFDLERRPAPGPAAAAAEIRGRLERLDGPPLQTNSSRY